MQLADRETWKNFGNKPKTRVINAVFEVSRLRTHVSPNLRKFCMKKVAVISKTLQWIRVFRAAFPDSDVSTGTVNVHEGLVLQTKYSDSLIKLRAKIGNKVSRIS